MDEAARQATAENERYLEVMENPDSFYARKIAQEIGWKEHLQARRDGPLERNLRPAHRPGFAGIAEGSGFRVKATEGD